MARVEQDLSSLAGSTLLYNPDGLSLDVPDIPDINADVGAAMVIPLWLVVVFLLSSPGLTISIAHNLTISNVSPHFSPGKGLSRRLKILTCRQRRTQRYIQVFRQYIREIALTAAAAIDHPDGWQRRQFSVYFRRNNAQAREIVR